MESIDAVITWVDGSDPDHQNKLNAYLNSIQSPRKPVIHKTRFSNDGEIEYCVKSILKFAPWISTIYIVTDNQEPSFLKNIDEDLSKKISIIDHTIIFKEYEEFLPTFNSRTIATMLWRIPGLSEKFIYFNDDIMLTGPTKPEDFFDGDNAVIRGHWHFALPKDFKDLIKRAKSRLLRKAIPARYSTSQRLSAKILGFKWRYFVVQHNPHPFLKSSWELFFAKHEDLVANQLHYKFRSVKQYNVDALSAHLCLKLGKAKIKSDFNNITIQPEKQNDHRVESLLTSAFNRDSNTFLCIQSLDNASNEVREKILMTLSQHISTTH